MLDGSHRLSDPRSPAARRAHHPGADRGGGRAVAALRRRSDPQAGSERGGPRLRRAARRAADGQRHPRVHRRTRLPSSPPRRVHPAHPADPRRPGVPPGGGAGLVRAQGRLAQHRDPRRPDLRNAAPPPGRDADHHHHRPRHGEGGGSMIELARRMSRVQASAIREILKVTERPDVLSFAGGLPAPEAFPAEALARAHADVLARDAAAALQYGPTEGHGPLRAWVAERMTGRGLPASPEQVLITAGSQQGIDLVAKTLIDPGDTVLVEAPSYLAALQCFSTYEARFETVETDENGMRVDALERALKAGRPKLIYLVPTFQNPRGTTLSLERRDRI